MRDPLASAHLFAHRQMLRFRAWRRWRGDADGDPAHVAPGERIPFVCNLCGTANSGTLTELSREAPSCTHCGSNVRFRAMAYLTTLEVLVRAQPLPEVAPRKDIFGLGLSDADAYARPLAEKFSYENTYYHTQPRLDIANIDAAREGRYDFVIASDVFEHVVPPVARAFENARRMLKPGGKFIFTVPFVPEGDTREHYPELHDWSMAENNGRWTLTNRTDDGREQSFTDLVFHGGPGSTLEMRLFSGAALEREFRAAGFSCLRVAAESCLRFGIHWPEPWSVPMVAYA
ncbi:MAG: class I SAM-dependent methyltransferase [Burkholderiales bacterium]|nr:class I SAM-dependent methyltransferase [Burkholderiales bacterium]